MTALMLLDSLEDHIKPLVAEYDLKTKEKIIKPPDVHQGYLPIKDKNSREESDYPFIILRLLSCKDEDNGSTATVKIIIGTYDEQADSKGWIDLLNIYNKIRLSLLEKRVIGSKYRLKTPVSFILHEEQPYPQFVGEITTEWELPMPINMGDIFLEE